jgi:hypothetical protein
VKAHPRDSLAAVLKVHANECPVCKGRFYAMLEFLSDETLVTAHNALSPYPLTRSQKTDDLRRVYRRFGDPLIPPHRP